jgi:predicted phosphodiesterase
MPVRRVQRLLVPLALVVSVVSAAAIDLTLPNQKDSLKFAIIGDSGTGSKSQLQIAQQLVGSRDKFPYECIVMMGDNLYGGSGEKDFVKKFEDPYKPLLDAGVKFYATLGNHDNPNERFYERWNMKGERYYTFRPKLGVRFFVLDSNYMDPKQLEWIDKELAASGSDWKICYFHHPLYSSGGAHGSDVQLRQQLEPMFLKHGVDVVLAGHEHFYERIKPQKGIYYFISGGAAKLRDGDVNTRSELTAKSYDTGYHFMLMELGKDTVYFQAINQDGKTVDSGALTRFSDADKKKLAGATE